VKAITETFFAADREAWRAWLAAHHAERSEIWLVFLKKHVGEPCVALDEAVEEALCFGWIDGLLRRIDERSHALRFSPRKATSQWSPSNKQRVDRLVAAGRMMPAGMAAVEAAKANAAWDDLASRMVDVTPDDLEQALAKVPDAAERWRTWPPSHRRAFIAWVLQAKRAETRQRRIDEVVRRAAANLRPGAELARSE
jgi:uncharacterized protein YdeI (YjbR/CyaY-like superfamily)